MTKKKKHLKQGGRPAHIVYKRSLVAKLDTWIRIIFIIEVFWSFLGFFFFPFRTTDVVKSHSPFNSKSFYQHIYTTGGKSFTLSSDRLCEVKLLKGDTIYLERNIFYKTEALTIKKVQENYFLTSKVAWLYIQFIFMNAGVASFYFNTQKDLHIKQFLTVVIEILCTLYFFV